MSSGRVLPLTQFVRACDVQDALGCSRSMAYWHLAQAIGVRSEEQKGRMLRCPLLRWERYAERVFQCRTTTIDSSDARASTDRSSGLVRLVLRRPGSADHQVHQAHRPARRSSSPRPVGARCG
jgi:hypothetical protein